MKKLIENIRQKPKQVKDQYAFYGAAMITFVIAVIWVVSLPVSFETTGKVEPDETERPAFSIFFDQVKGQFAGLREDLQDVASSARQLETATVTDGVSVSSTTSVVNSIEEAITNSMNKPPQAENEVISPKYVLIGTTTATTSPALVE